MARIQYSALVTAIKGSIGGLSFQQNQSGHIIRLKPNRKQASNNLQNVRKGTFSKAVTAWNDLSQTLQDGWATAAASFTYYNYWGEVKVISGFNFFIACYSNALLLGQTPPTSAPPSPSSPVTDNFSGAADTPDFSINWQPFFDHSQYYLLIFCSPPRLASNSINRKQLRYVTSISPAITTGYEFENEYNAAFGYSTIPAPTVGKFYIQVSIAAIDKDYFFSGKFTSFVVEVNTP